MSDYAATATHDGRWWVIEVHGVGVTQARTVTETQEMVEDLVHLLTDDPAPQVDVTFRVGWLNATVLAKTVRGKVTKAQAALGDAARANRDAARKLSAAGVSGNDIAGLLHVSPQRVSQLLTPAGASTAAQKSTVRASTRKRNPRSKVKRPGSVSRRSGRVR